MAEAGKFAGNAAEDGQALRILFVTSDKYPPIRPAAKAIFTGGLPSRGHTVDWLIQAGDGETLSGNVAHDGGTAYVAPSLNARSRFGRFRKYWLDLRNDLRIFRLLGQRQYSLVQIKDKYIGALIAILAARMRGVPVFYWLAYPHGEASLYASKQGDARYPLFYAVRGHIQKWLLYRLIMPACAHVFVQSEQMRRDVEREGIGRDKTTAVPSSVNLADIDAALDEPAPQKTDEKTVLYVGTLLRERQLDFLVRAFRHVVSRVPDARLVFVGRGENPWDEPAIRDEAERLSISEQVTITGWMPLPQAWQQVRAADVCVSPYLPIPILSSTSPTKLIEYMALGKPVVANEHPEQTQIVRKYGTGLVCKWNEADFADALVTLLERPAMRKAMGVNGRRFVERHRTHAHLTDRIIGVYENVLKSQARANAARPLAAQTGEIRE